MQQSDSTWNGIKCRQKWEYLLWCVTNFRRISFILTYFVIVFNELIGWMEKFRRIFIQTYVKASLLAQQNKAIIQKAVEMWDCFKVPTHYLLHSYAKERRRQWKKYDVSREAIPFNHFNRNCIRIRGHSDFPFVAFHQLEFCLWHPQHTCACNNTLNRQNKLSIWKSRSG